MTTRPPSSSDKRAIEAALDLAAAAAGAKRPLTLAQLQGLYDAALRHPSKDMVEAVGISFGEELRHVYPLEWVLCDDEYGSELALEAMVPGMELRVHPVSMMANRIEDGEAVDLQSLGEDTVETLNRAIAEEEPED